MALDLTAPPDVLPLGFELGEHLAGAKSPFQEASGGTVDGPSLAAEGLGPHRIILHGLTGESEGGLFREALQPWQRTVTLAGTLDPDALARVLYATVRAHVQQFPKGETPPEVYVTRIQINPMAQPQPKPKPKPKPKPEPIRPPIIRYRDRDTGRLVKHDTWLRSRRARRARGLTGPGRYVRVRL